MADGHDVINDYRAARSKIGLVPQELSTDSFETVRATVSFSRGLFGKAANPDYIEKVLKDLSLWDRKDSKILTLSGGMKRRVMIAKALSHEPRILFLDEPAAEQMPRDGDFGHLIRDVAVADELRADLDQLILRARQRSTLDRFRRRQRPARRARDP